MVIYYIIKNCNYKNLMLLIIYYKKFNIVLNQYTWIFDHVTKQKYGKFSNFYILIPNSNILIKNHLLIVLYNSLVKEYFKILTHITLLKYFKGTTMILKLTGLGYKFDYYTNTIVLLNVGYSHRLFIKIPNIVSYSLNQDKTNMTLFSFNKLILSSVAAKLQNLKQPDPYKGKGIFLIKNTFKGGINN